jgi:hypothetical protein
MTEPQVIQRALDALEGEGFEARLEHLTQAEGWLLRWRRNGAKWYASRRTLTKLGEGVLGWLEARRSGSGDEESYAHEGDVPRRSA